MPTVYEWDVEGNIQSHTFAHNYREASVAAALPRITLTPHIVLVCDDPRGRSRSYLVNGKLPVFFTDLDGLTTTIVPARFHKLVSQGA